MGDNKTQASQNQAAKLFDLIFGQCTNGLLEVRALEQDTPYQRFFPIPSQMAQAAKFAVGLHHEVFFGVAVRSEHKATADCVAKLSLFWVDADDGAVSWTNFLLGSLAILNSGHPSGTHFHAYYALKTPFKVATEWERAKALAYLRTLARIIARVHVAKIHSECNGDHEQNEGVSP